MSSLGSAQLHLQRSRLECRAQLPFDVPAARAFAGVTASLHSTGRKTAARAYDAMIAATAIANGLPVYTCNPADFAGIDDLVVVPVVQSDRPRSSAPQ